MKKIMQPVRKGINQKLGYFIDLILKTGFFCKCSFEFSHLHCLSDPLATAKAL